MTPFTFKWLPTIIGNKTRDTAMYTHMLLHILNMVWFSGNPLDAILQMDSLSTSCEIALIWIPHNLIDDESTLIQVMAMCR